ncbi:MAG: PQQ-dependent sugar dehydrogenase [Planctomycetes bacterium]|nr:PQQ-dependent sugar dehydrogenase [Planctomycetota bacterium]MCB9884889.1 PQQ-dependent sugar dehydrogenase [Planctomycetota bacterium]
MTKHTHLLAALLASLPAALTAPLAAQNHPPAAPTITEPSTPNRILNPNDVHMETAPFVDPDAGDQHAATDWEIWTVTPNQRVWVAANLTGVERVHTHLGDGIFENSHGGWNRLFASTQYTLRVRHKDDSGDPATEWSPWTATAFATGAAEVKSPLLLDDAADNPPPTWTDANGVAIDLPTGTPNPVLRLETDSRWLLLRLDGDPATGNRVTNPGALPLHRAVRVVIDAGNTGSVLSLPATDLTVHASNCERHVIRLPAVTLAPFQSRAFWVGEHGTTYDAVPTAYVPNFSTLARGLDVPWIARRPGFVVDVVATGMTMPVNIAFVPNPGSLPSSPKYYVTELYGSIRTVTNDGSVFWYATGLLNYTPSGVFPGSGEQGLTGICVDPVSGDVFASHLWRTGGQNYPRITRLTSTNGGLTSSSRQVILDMQGEVQGQSHQVSNLEIVGGELYCHMGDGFNYQTAQNLSSYRGKILRMQLNGAPVTSNPYYNGGTADARDYIFALGVRNPFGGAWRAADGNRYCVENGPSVDRFSKLVRARNYGWDNTDLSMTNFAIHNWDPSSGPVNIAWVQPQTFGGSGFPAQFFDHAFVTESGATYAQGQQSIGKRITEFVLDAAGNLVSGPIPFVDYVGDGHATAAALAAGPDGLYFSEFYRDANSTGPTASGGRILRVAYGDPGDCDGNGLPDLCEIAGGEGDCNGNLVLDVCDLRVGTSHDFDGNGHPDECDPLFASVDTLSLGSGGRVDFTLDAGAAQAGGLYQLVGSMSGTSPGTAFGPVLLPLNTAGDPWFQLTWTPFSTAILQNTISNLDAAGRGQAAIVIPPLPLSLVGLQFHHAFLVWDAATQQHTYASNAVPLTLVP